LAPDKILTEAINSRIKHTLSPHTVLHASCRCHQQYSTNIIIQCVTNTLPTYQLVMLYGF